MRPSRTTFAALLFALLALAGAATSLAARGADPASPDQRGGPPTVRGLLTDESGGVLPGVTVAAIGPDGQVLATALTNQAGAYDIGPLAAARVTLTFQLEGFTTASLPVTVAGAGATVNQRLVIAPQTEQVMVYAQAPVLLPAPAPPPPAPPAPRPRPRPLADTLPEHDRDSICGPAKLGAAIESRGRVLSRRSSANQLYGEGDELVVWGGRVTGLAVGRNFVVRRSYRGDLDRGQPTAEHTSGVVQIVDAGEFTSVAVVVYACDEMMAGDRLAPFRPEPVRPPEPAGIPDYDNPARILFADAAQLLGMPRRLMVIDRGTRSAVRVGQRLTLFRRRLVPRHEVVVIGDAVVVATRDDSATIRVEQATDAIWFGDWAAPQQPDPAATGRVGAAR
jgi:carboxypeptidase family protein